MKNYPKSAFRLQMQKWRRERGEGREGGREGEERQRIYIAGVLPL